MSERVRTRGLVLKKLDYSDSSIIVTLFTYTLGKVKVIIRGAKRPKSRFVSVFETFNVVETVIQVKENREIQHVSDAKTLMSYVELRKSYLKQVWAGRVMRFVDSVLPELSPSKGLYSLTERTLFMLAHEKNEEAVFVAYVSKALKVLGYGIHLSSCMRCGDMNVLYLSPSRGGGICTNCAKTENYLIYLTHSGVESLQCLYDGSLSTAAKFQASGLVNSILKYAETVTHVEDLYEKVMVRRSHKK